jgi:hypothetical protein
MVNHTYKVNIAKSENGLYVYCPSLEILVTGDSVNQAMNNLTEKILERLKLNDQYKYFRKIRSIPADFWGIYCLN